VIETTTLVVNVSDEAQAKLREIIASKNQPNLAVRVFAQGAGEGMARYGMALDGEQLADDTVLEFDGFKMLVDRESTEFMNEAELDFQDSLMGAGFTLQSPHFAQPTGGCGCGGGSCGCGGGGGGGGCGCGSH
jgi:iron-sulfur cluster assembly protein